MYLIPVEVKKSPIDGRGVFTTQPVAEGTLVWKFTPGHDLSMSLNDFEHLDQVTKASLEGVGYISPASGNWVYPPDNDPARFTNHSQKNNLTASVDLNVSEEPYFITNRDIAVGEELTNNYHEFDKLTQETHPTWAQP